MGCNPPIVVAGGRKGAQARRAQHPATKVGQDRLPVAVLTINYRCVQAWARDRIISYGVIGLSAMTGTPAGGQAPHRGSETLPPCIRTQAPIHDHLVKDVAGMDEDVKGAVWEDDAAVLTVRVRDCHNSDRVLRPREGGNVQR